MELNLYIILTVISRFKYFIDEIEESDNFKFIVVILFINRVIITQPNRQTTEYLLNTLL